MAPKRQAALAAQAVSDPFPWIVVTTPRQNAILVNGIRSLVVSSTLASLLPLQKLSHPIASLKGLEIPRASPLLFLLGTASFCAPEASNTYRSLPPPQRQDEDFLPLALCFGYPDSTAVLHYTRFNSGETAKSVTAGSETTTLLAVADHGQNMAAYAASEIEPDFETPPKAPKAPKASKNAKSSNLKSDTKASGTKALGNKATGTKTANKKSSAAKPSDGPSIPLLCCVCVNHPRFSDVSHLLTHLSSKGHLHTLNTTKVRSHADLSAAETIATYEKWYSQNNLEYMLAERLLAKDGKSANKGKLSGQPPAQSLKRKKTLPLLVKLEEDNDSSWTPPQLPMNGLSLERQQAITFYGDAGESPVTETSSDWLDEDPETVRLKGIIWPGMSLFDAATPDQKKKRNQRKDASVLRLMELASQAITTTETVANLDFEIERTRDVYDAASVEGSPLPKKPRRRQKRSRTVANDADGTPEIIVKSEPDDQHFERASRSASVQSKISVQAQEQSPEATASLEADSESSENLDVTSDIDATGDAEIDLDMELDDARFGDDRSLRGFATQHLFNLPDEHDVFRDGGGATEPPRWSNEMMDEARFGIRNRIPLQPINPNSNLNLDSPTPAAKQLSHRIFRGKENNRGLQEQGLGSDSYHFGGPNTHLNQARMPGANTANPFSAFQPPHGLIYPHGFPGSWLPPVSRAPANGFNPINGNANHQLFFGNQMLPLAAGAFNANENDHGHGMGMFGEGV